MGIQNLDCAFGKWCWHWWCYMLHIRTCGPACDVLLSPIKETMQFSWLNFAEICFHCLSCLLHAAKLECLVLVMILVAVITCMLFALSIYLSAFILLVFEGRIGKAICYLYFSSLYLAFILFSLCFHRNGRINQGIWEMGKKGVRDKATYKSFKEKTEVSFFVFFFSELPFLLPLW